MKTKELAISGMSCHHCVLSIRKALEAIPGVKVEEVRIGSARITYDETAVNDDTLGAAVTEAGYTLVRS